jgi:putative tryptophan/tyrosine transport system substrate-binding protein
MRRRDFVKGMGGSAIGWPLAARAQQVNRIRRIGYLSSNAESDPQFGPFPAAFNEGLRKLGWIDGNSIKIEVRWSAADLGRMTA